MAVLVSPSKWWGIAHPEIANDHLGVQQLSWLVTQTFWAMGYIKDAGCLKWDKTPAAVQPLFHLKIRFRNKESWIAGSDLTNSQIIAMVVDKQIFEGKSGWATKGVAKCFLLSRIAWLIKAWEDEVKVFSCQAWWSMLPFSVDLDNCTVFRSREIHNHYWKYLVILLWLIHIVLVKLISWNSFADHHIIWGQILYHTGIRVFWEWMRNLMIPTPIGTYANSPCTRVSKLII